MADYNLGTAHGKIEIDVDTRGVNRAESSLDDLESSTDRAGGGLKRLDRQSRATAGGMNIVAATLAVMTTRMGVLVVAAVAAAGIATELSGVVGLLPGLLTAAGLAVGTLAAGFRGFGEAMSNMGDPEAFAESLEKLAPQAREAAIAVRDLAPAWREMQQAVQNQLFSETGLRITALSNTYLPMLRESMVNTAEGMNSALHDVIDMLQETGRQADMKTILDASAGSATNFVNMLRPLISVFLDLAAVGAPIMERLSASALGATQRFAEFVSKARETGQLQEWIERGMQAFADLWNILGLLTGTVTNLVAALGGPDSLLGILTLVAEALNVMSGFIAANIGWLGPLAAAIGAVTLAFKLWNAAQMALHAFSLIMAATNPWMIIVGLVIAAITLIIMNWDKVKAFLIATWELIKSVASTVWNAILSFFQTVLGAIASFFTSIWNGISSFLSGVWSGISSAASAVWNAIVNFITGAIQSAQSIITSVMNAVSTFWSAVWNTVKTVASTIWNGIISVVTGAINGVRNVLTSVVNGITSFLSAAWNGALSVVRSVWGAITGTISGAINGAMSLLSGLPGRVMGIFSSAGSWLLSAGRNLITGLWNGVSGMFNWVMGKIRGFAGSIVSGIKGLFGIGSPSKVFADEIGHWLPPGIAVGIEANADSAMRAARDLADNVTGVVSMSAGGPDAFWSGRGTGPGYVPPSREVASYSAAQGDAPTTPAGDVKYEFNTYNPVAERASDSEARRLRALSSLGAF